MKPSEMLQSARSSGYGESPSSEAETGSINRSFPLTEEELRGLGEGPMSLRVDGEGREGKFQIKSIVKFGENTEEDTKAEPDEDD